jgi:hypothetical protein
MKGFVRILEAVISSIILLAAVSYFFIIEPQYSEWDVALIQTRAEDAMASLDNAGILKTAVSRNDSDMLYTNLSKIFPKSVNFITHIENRVYPVIYVSYIGSDVDRTRIFGSLPIYLKFRNRTITIYVEGATIDNIKEKTNVIFIAGMTNLPSDRAKLEKFLKNGTAVFLFSDLSSNDFAGAKDEILKDVFGLKWSGGSTGATFFYDHNDVNKTSFVIANHFENLTGEDRTHSFTGFTLGSNRIGIDNKTIISGGQSSFVKVNYDVQDGNGRTVWFAKYNFADTDGGNIKSALFASLLWASSERYDFNPQGAAMPPNNVPVYEYKYLVYDQEPYSVNIKIWQVFY